MYIILMRHGDAEPESETVSNRNRGLTEAGRKHVKKTAKMLAKYLGDQKVHIWASPYKRTKETALIVSEYLNAPGIMTTEKLLQGTWAMTASQIVREGGPIIMVSHHPFIQSYVLSMTSSVFKVPPAGAAVIDYDVSWKQGKLIGFLTPALGRMK